MQTTKYKLPTNNWKCYWDNVNEEIYKQIKIIRNGTESKTKKRTRKKVQ